MTNVAVIVGEASGLGAALAERLANAYAIVGVSRRTFGDASKREVMQRALDHAQSLGTPTLLVNSAGVGIYGPAGSYDEASVASLLEANLIATIQACEVFLPLFARNGGTIVNILSTAALTGKANESVYCAAKWGARGYTEALRAEAKGTKAKIVAIYPGGMQTPFWPEPREGFMDARDVAEVICEAIGSKVNVSDVTIVR